MAVGTALLPWNAKHWFRVPKDPLASISRTPKAMVLFTPARTLATLLNPSVGSRRMGLDVRINRNRQGARPLDGAQARCVVGIRHGLAAGLLADWDLGVVGFPETSCWFCPCCGRSREVLEAQPPSSTVSVVARVILHRTLLPLLWDLLKTNMLLRSILRTYAWYRWQW